MTTPLHKSTLRALSCFAAGLLLLLLVTAFEHAPPLDWLFNHSAGALAYLALQIAVFLAGLGFAFVSLWRGTTRDRLLLAIPLALVLFYLALLIAGPG